jgi:hypothetical protein
MRIAYGSSETANRMAVYSTIISRVYWGPCVTGSIGRPARS